ncbi:MAG: ANTAR domain-containing protein [Agathobaculum sp.]|uniref:ANTAR domain-containing response regulator n=1 Tax=Agathobaculum sp. TaxID=2048138 RepID=UPI0025C5ACFF|nr:ANTAR domain-containing protein [Agathobaculum sp.]MCI7126583.1 ANTAR domain-containing protein [Agathobaculum sp.]MDY3712506.1 ANTAR domain-containing protein [Agathobaculum sp.]
MEHILIVSATAKSLAMLTQFLSSCAVQAQIATATSCAEARRTLLDTDYDLLLVNAPLPDEFGHELAQTAAQDTLAGVILLAKTDIADAVSEKVEDGGVIVVPKPLSRTLFLQALRMIRASRARLAGLQKENRQLQKRIEDIRLVDRAKCLLIECCAMTEPEAHRYIERQAMEQRLTKREVAERILSGGLPG